MALDRNGKILHWGEIYFPDEDTDIFSPIRVKGLEQVPFSMIAAGNGYTLAVTELRNTIYSWGKQFHNRLFTTKTEIVDNDISGPLATPIPNREKVEALSVSRFHGIAVTNDGSLFV